MDVKYINPFQSEYDIKVSVPMTIQGVGHTLTWPDYAPIIGIPFHTAHGPFLVDVCLIDLKSPKKDAPRAAVKPAAV